MSVKIFCCYAHEDKPLLDRLKKQLKPLQRQALIEIWHDGDISAGTEWEQEIKKRLNDAQIILLLVSPDFMASDYCYGIEIVQALERHKRKEARVVPIILRPVSWMDTLGNLQALPTDAKPVMSSSWYSTDDAFFDIEKGLRKVIEDIEKGLKVIEMISERPETRLHFSPEQSEEISSNRVIERVTDSQNKNSDLQTVEAQFHQAMIDIYKEAKKIGYHATQFLRMVNEEGGIKTAHVLLAKDPTEGFTTLWEKKRLDLSVEALVLKSQFTPLFDEIEREKARKRLAEYQYKAPWDSNRK